MWLWVSVIGCDPNTPVVDPCDRDGDGDESIDCGGDDCDDLDPNRFSGNTEICDPAGHDEDCDASTFGETDADGDGVKGSRCGGDDGDDCDDDDEARYPGATELCDASHDEDCNDTTHGADVDGDGYVSSACCNGSSCGADCDDVRPAISPGGLEACDGVDNDCDGVIDNGVIAMSYVDEDGDGYGTGPAEARCIGAGYASIGGDCDDTLTQIHPGAFRCAPDVNASLPDIDVCGDDGMWTSSSCPDLGRCVPQPDATGVCLPGQSGLRAACANGLDDDMDGYVDYVQVPNGSFPPDTGCNNATDNSERGPADSPNQCDNGVDDDMDGVTDYPADVGCKSPQSAEE